jgi:hypothetical protein
MNRFFKTTLSSLILIGGTSPLFAQNDGQKVSFRAICLEYQDDVKEVQLASSEEGELELWTQRIGRPQDATFSDNIATFYVTDPEAENGKRVVARGSLANSSRQLFLFLPATDDEDLAYNVLCMPDNVANFAMGGVRVVNFSPGPVRFKFSGTDLKPIGPKKISTYPAPKVDQWNMFQVDVFFANPEGDWVRVASPAWKSTEHGHAIWS